MNIAQVVERLKDESFINASREGLKSWPDVQAADIDRVIRWMSALRDDIIALVQEINDEDEVTTTLAIQYIELKSRWIAMNTKINYQTFRTQSCDTLTALRAAAISALVGRVEDLLTPQDIDQITTFLSEPIRRAA